MSLSVSRRKDEAVWIGGARVVIAKQQADKVRLRIEAGASIEIFREELLREMAIKEPERFQKLGFEVSEAGHISRPGVLRAA